VANVHLATKQNLTIIPIINKIDLPHADVAATKKANGGHPRHSERARILASAKEGIGIDDILEAVVRAHSGPHSDRRVSACRRWEFDSYFDMI